jgi:hypothetical protein
MRNTLLYNDGMRQGALLTKPNMFGIIQYALVIQKDHAGKMIYGK